MILNEISLSVSRPPSEPSLESQSEPLVHHWSEVRTPNGWFELVPWFEIV